MAIPFGVRQFAGAQRLKGQLAIRNCVFDVCEAAMRCGLVDCRHDLEGIITCRMPVKLVSLSASAHFCLHLRVDFLNPSCTAPPSTVSWPGA